MADRIVQAYAPKQYDGKGRYVVIGSGIASVNEWANAIDAGAKCISLVRNPSPDEQDLNTPRCFFEALGIDAFQQLDFDQRIEFLGRILKGTAPNRRGWDAKIKTGREEQRFEQIIGEIDEIKPGPLGLRIHVMSKFGEDPGWMDVTGIVTGTGFNKSALSVPLMRRLIEFYDVPIADGRMKLQSNCGVPGLDRPDSRLAAMGIHANAVITHGDTIAGLKYIGRRFVADCYQAEKPKRRRFLSKLALQLSRETTNFPNGPFRSGRKSPSPMRRPAASTISRTSFTLISEVSMLIVNDSRQSLNDAGITPMISCGSPSTRMVCPTMSSRPPKRFCQQR